MMTSFIEAETVAKIASRMKGNSRKIWLLMNDTGLRVSDAVKVKYGDIDKKGYLHYKAQKTGKTGIIRISGEVLALLGRGKSDEYIFKSAKFPHKHIHRSTVFRHIKTACKRAGINSDGIACHSARKAFAVRDFRENGLGKTMHDLLHSDAATTLFYALSDNPIPRIFAQLKIIDQSLNMHLGFIEDLSEKIEMLFRMIVDIDAPIDVKLPDEKRGENSP
jgi:integrase